VSIQRVRQRLPLAVFIFLFLLALMLVGLACACLTEHPMQAVDRAITAIPAAPAIVDIWAVSIAAVMLAVWVRRPCHTCGRASPAQLQRFRF
jgi:hypothetical protein